ncbi:hypothetical protein E2C01_016911 [Portunus trituberculatus]|uniref:Uncharacterized protein n=1 Tax=Portunus trituberculatus TaxID=210409 RepID=A0A5B7DS10_PORTR|nr:hypothetical protein [Portunus trituberculatus]
MRWVALGMAMTSGPTKRTRQAGRSLPAPSSPPDGLHTPPVGLCLFLCPVLLARSQERFTPPVSQWHILMQGSKGTRKFRILSSFLFSKFLFTCSFMSHHR